MSGWARRFRAAAPEATDNRAGMTSVRWRGDAEVLKRKASMGRGSENGMANRSSRFDCRLGIAAVPPVASHERQNAIISNDATAS
jgi:hypothetical protein